MVILLPPFQPKSIRMRALTAITCLAILFFSCSKELDEDQPNLLVGTWEQSESIEGTNFIQLLQYNFKADKSFNLSRTIIDRSTAEIVGYLYRSSGTYDTNGSRLKIMEAESHLHNDTNRLYSDLEDLQLSQYKSSINVTFSIIDKKQLVFDYDPCGINENCISSQTFRRLE